MEATLFKQVGYSLSKLIEDIDMGEIGCRIFRDLSYGTLQRFEIYLTRCTRAFRSDTFCSG
jgi:hypothetical protein